MRTRLRVSRAFSLIDCVAAIAAFGILGLCTAVALAQQFEINTFPRRANILRQFSQAMTLYALNNADFFAGSNTSGAAAQATNGAAVVGTRTSATPTSSDDWISPTRGLVTSLSASRAARLQALLNRHRSWINNAPNALLFGSPATPDFAEFLSINAQGGFRSVSYLSPSAFHFFPNSTVASQNRYQGVTLKFTSGGPVTVAPAYRPRISDVGVQPSNKIYAADGSRFVTPTSIDLDINPNPASFGNFIDPGAILHTSTAYGRQSSSSGRNVNLSFRQPDGSLDAAMFDGSVRNISRTTAWTDASLWYPGGSTFTGAGATPESQAATAPGTILP